MFRVDTEIFRSINNLAGQVDWMALRPDFLGSIYRFFAFEYPKSWVVQRGNRLLGALTWKSTHTYADPLWLASPQNIEEEAIHALLVYARRQISRRRPLALNYPAGVTSEAIRAAGFYPQQTLVWMENSFD